MRAGCSILILFNPHNRTIYKKVFSITTNLRLHDLASEKSSASTGGGLVALGGLLHSTLLHGW